MSGTDQNSAIRPPILAGAWYPADPVRLARDVGGYLDAAPEPEAGIRPTAVVSPHAGYAYSGPTAGRVLGLLRGLEYDRVFILAPSHRAWTDRICTAPFSAYSTPLGEVPVDREASRELESNRFFAPDAEAHAGEHAVEIQLPLLQAALGDRLRIVPLLVPQLDTEARGEAAAALGRWCDGRSLFVVSTDFTHYGASYGYVPFTDRIPERLAELDGGAIDLLLAGDAAGLVEYGRRTGITMCGLEAAALVLSAPLPRGGARRIAYERSGDRDRDYSLSVSYAALVLAASAAPDAEAADG